MALEFKNKWNEAIPKYVKKFGEYQAFLDTLNESAIRQAFARAEDQFTDTNVLALIRIANNSFNSEKLTIEQGSHQPEDLQGGGFCLHFTGRDSDGLAYHFYIIQNSSGYPIIIRVSYRTDQIVNAYRNHFN